MTYTIYMSEKTKIKLLIAAMIATTVPFFWAVKHPTSWALTGANVKSLALYLSAILGYAGLSLFIWQMILGTRSISAQYFMDMPEVLKIHRWLGKYATLLIFLHPVFVMISYAENWLYIFVPSLGGEFSTHVTYGRLAFWALLLIWITSALVRGKIKYRPWRYIHYLTYPMLGLTLLHIPGVGTSYPLKFVQFYWLLFVVTALLAVGLRLRFFFGFGKYRYKVTDMRQITDLIWMVRLKADEKMLRIHNGQFVYLQPSLWGEEHPFTVLDYDNDIGEITLGFKVFGPFTRKISQLKAGDSVLLDGPYGVYTAELVEQPLKPSVFIAGGIGVTPFVKYSIEQTGERWMFYANQTEDTAAFRDVLKRTLGTRYVDILTRVETPRSDNNEREYLSGDMIKRYLPEPALYDYFICGSKQMMSSSRQVLLDLGVPKNRIHIEEFAF